MLRYRTQGALAVGLGILAAGCLSDPTLKTNLRPEGPPEVLALLAVDVSGESAAYCKYVGTELDEKGPGLVQGSTICPEAADEFTATELFPLGWDVRVVFDELLNGDVVEELDCDRNDDGIEDDPLICQGHIENTQPVTLECGGTQINYGGYYYPNGNKESFPVGPAIYVSPDPADLVFPTGTACTLTITDVVVDKDGVAVASGANSNVFNLKIQDLGVFDTIPHDAPDVLDREVLGPDAEIIFAFNADLDATTVTATDATLLDDAGTPVLTATVTVGSENGASDAILISSAVDLAPGNYTARLLSGASFTEVNGGTVTLTENIDVRFVVE